MKKIFQSPVILPLILLVAIAIVVLAVKTKAPVEHEVIGYPVKPVETITLEKIPFRARAMAYGYVEPAVALDIKSEVSGKIIYIHPQLKKGASLSRGTVVLRIEPTIFEFSLEESQAALANNRSSLVQLKVEESSSREAKLIVQKNLDVELKELDRSEALRKKGIISQSTLDKEKQKVLTLRQQLQDIDGKIAGYASRKNAILAQIKQAKSQVDKSQDTLDRTEVRLPFDARIGSVAVENDEFVQAGYKLFEASGVQAVEINAQISTRQFRPLVSGLKPLQDESINLQNSFVLQTALSNMRLEARVRLVGDMANQAVWDGTLLRLSESVDPTRDTLGLVVVINNPYEGIVPGKRPPLLKGMYTSVEFLSPSHPAIILPRKALHQGRVYISGENNSLIIRSVNIAFTQGDLVVLVPNEPGVEAGDKIIISEVIPVMEGMPLKPIAATDYEKDLRRIAMGKSLQKQLSTDENE